MGLSLMSLVMLLTLPKDGYAPMVSERRGEDPFVSVVNAIS